MTFNYEIHMDGLEEALCLRTLKHEYIKLTTNLVCADFVSSVAVSRDSVGTHNYSRDAPRTHECSHCAVTHQRRRDLLVDQLVRSESCALHVRSSFRAVDMLWTTRQ